MVDIVDKALRMGEGHQLKKLENVAKAVNALEDEISALSDEELKGQTAKFKQRLDNGENLDKLMPEAFATVREVSKRTLGQRHFDVQLMGGAALHWGNIAEMKTGEGKTLVATLPAYLNALDGQGVHVVTVNDYLASYQAELMGRVYRFLGMSTGCIITNQKPSERRKQYNADITYGTNNEYGFDYLRDNIVYDSVERVQRPLNYAIVDEVDSILIDEARTPLIISGQSEDQTDLYEAMNRVPPMLTRQEGEENPITGEGVTKPGDFTVDEKAHQVYLTEQGHENAEAILQKMGLLPEDASLYDPANIALMHHLYAALRAHNLYHRDQHYVVQDGEKGPEIVIVDEFTGRLMSGRRWSDGLHQAVEAKENVPIQAENQTMATITFQNYFRLYKKLAGMTGTADTEAFEFQEIYALETVVIPPNRPNKREDQLDRVYKTTPEKYQAALQDIRECHERGQPVLVGTTSIENSEIISQLLKQAKLPHQVLNAKQHEREAEIVAQAGRPGMITIATNMAGRGTDIMLGGNVEFLADAKLKSEGYSPDDTPDEYEKRWPGTLAEIKEQVKDEHEEVVELGGLYVLGTERHESRRIDNQLRGRSGRQGDPGESRFYISLEDDLMRLFGSERLMNVFNALGVEDGEQIEHKMLSSAIEKAQEKIESNNFGIRKNLLEYDQVMNEQREIIYEERRRVLDGESMRDTIYSMITEYVENMTDRFASTEADPEEWDIKGLDVNLHNVIPQLQLPSEKECQSMSQKELKHLLKERGVKAYENKEAEFPEAEQLREVERVVLLKVIDARWMDHIDDMDQLRQGIGLQAYGQRDPLVEYKMTGYEMFGEMTNAIAENTIRTLFHIKVEQKVEREEVAKVTGTNKDDSAVRAPKKREEKKIYPNDPCPCGSGKKYKYCCGKNA